MEDDLVKDGFGVVGYAKETHEELISKERFVVPMDENIEIIGTAEQRQKMFFDWGRYFAEVQNPVSSKEVRYNALYYKYAPMDVVLDVLRPTLGKYGLSMIQTAFNSGTQIAIGTMVVHRDGGAMSFPILKGNPTKLDVQGIGSIITYIRRYTATAIFGVIGTGEDDDGISTIETKHSAKTKPAPLNSELMTAKKKCITVISDKITELGDRELVLEVISKIEASGNINDIMDADKIKQIEVAVSKLKGEK